MDEIKILKQIAEGDPDDKMCVVKLLDHFKHSGRNGQHVCMVFEYLGDNLLTLIKYSDYRGLPIQKVKEICFHILAGLDYLHRQLSIIHTDLKPENLLLLSMIDPTKDPTKSGSPLVPPSYKSKILSESGASKDVKSLNGDLTKNQKKKIRKKAERGALKCAGKEASEETEPDNEASSPEDITRDDKAEENSVEEQTRNKASEDVLGHHRTQKHKRGSRSARQKLLGDVGPNCKLVDFGMHAGRTNNSQVIFRQDSIDVRRLSWDLNILLQQIFGPLRAFALSLPLVMYYLILTVVTIMNEMRITWPL